MRKASVIGLLAAAAGILVALTLGMISLVLIGYDTGPAGLLLGFLMAAVPVPFYVMFIRWIDHFEPEPWWLLSFAFLWGAAVASFVALVFNSINVAIFTAALGEGGDALGAVVSAPVVEELAKGVALFILFFWQRSQFDNVTDGIVYASMVGLGFAMTENVLYYGRAFAEGGVPSAGVLFFMRGIMSPFAHPLFTSMLGIGLGAARESDNVAVKWIAPLAGLGSAVLLHAVWNLSATFGAVFFVTYLLIMVPMAAAVLIVALFSLRREARVVRLHLESIVHDGVLSGDDLVRLCSPWGRISASGSALVSGGLGAWRARGRFHRAATDFAFHSWRTTRGLSEGSEDARASLIDSLRAARVAAGLEPVAATPAPELVRRLTMEIAVPAVDSARERRVLRCVAGSLEGKELEVGPSGLTIGRDAGSAGVVVAETLVSKRHVWVGHRDDELVAIDRGSTNGTTVNGFKVREAKLRPGDRLTLAGVVTFEVG